MLGIDATKPPKQVGISPEKKSRLHRTRNAPPSQISRTGRNGPSRSYVADHIKVHTSNLAPSGSCATRAHSIGSPANVEVLAATNKRALTLVTCFPFNYLGAAPRRFIVRALQVPASEHLEQRNGRMSQSVNPHGQALVSS